MKTGRLSETVQQTTRDTSHDPGDRTVRLTALEFTQQAMRKAKEDEGAGWEGAEGGD